MQHKFLAIDTEGIAVSQPLEQPNALDLNAALNDTISHVDDVEKHYYEEMMAKERELIKQLLEVHAVVSLHNKSLNLYEMINRTDGL